MSAEADVRTVTRAEGRALLEQAAQRNLGMSADEFVSLWDSGALRGDKATRRVMRVAMLLPLGR